MVFDVVETGVKRYSVKASDVSGVTMFTFNLNDGNVSDLQLSGPGTQTGCSGIYLTGMVGTIYGTATGGPLGFGIGMGLMIFNLWDNNCL